MTCKSTIHISTFLRLHTGALVPIADHSKCVDDEDYIEGALEIQVNKKIVIPRKYWDYIDQLWSYFVNALIGIHEGQDSFEISYPDQPIIICITRLSGKSAKILFKGGLDKIEEEVDWELLVESIIISGLSFFEKMKELNPGKAEVYQCEINRLKNTIIKK